MKKLWTLFIALLLMASLLDAAAFEKEAKSATVSVVISSDQPLTTGNNTLHIKLQDAKYKDAKVRIKVFMPAMPGMPRMEEETDAKAVGGMDYDATVNLSMEGTWQVWVFIAPKEGKKVRIKTSLNI